MMIQIGRPPGRQMSALVPNARAINRMSTIVNTLRKLDFNPMQFMSSVDASGVHVSLSNSVTSQGDDMHFDVDLGPTSVKVHAGLWMYDVDGSRHDLQLNCDNGLATDYDNYLTVNVPNNLAEGNAYVILKTDDWMAPTECTAYIANAMPTPWTDQPRTELALARLTITNVPNSTNVNIPMATAIEQNIHGDLVYGYDAPLDNCSLGWVNVDDQSSESGDSGSEEHDIWKREIQYWHNASEHAVNPPGDTDYFHMQNGTNGCSEYFRWDDMKNAVNALIPAPFDCSDWEDCSNNYNYAGIVANYPPANHNHIHYELEFGANANYVGCSNGDQAQDDSYWVKGAGATECFGTSIGYGTARAMNSGNIRIDLANCLLVTTDGSNSSLDWQTQVTRIPAGANTSNWASRSLFGPWTCDNTFHCGEGTDATNCNGTAGALQVNGGASLTATVSANAFQVCDGNTFKANANIFSVNVPGNVLLEGGNVIMRYGPNAESSIIVGNDTINIYPSSGGIVSYEGINGQSIADWYSVGGFVASDAQKYYVLDEDSVRIEVIGRPAPL